jgi:hypothetical protein
MSSGSPPPNEAGQRIRISVSGSKASGARIREPRIASALDTLSKQLAKKTTAGVLVEDVLK